MTGLDEVLTIELISEASGLLNGVMLETRVGSPLWNALSPLRSRVEKSFHSLLNRMTCEDWL